MSSQLTQLDSLDTESELSSFRSALTLLSFVLPDRVAALQNGNDVGNAIGQIIQDFTTAARLPRRERDQAVEHVEPQPQITKKRRDDE